MEESIRLPVPIGLELSTISVAILSSFDRFTITSITIATATTITTKKLAHFSTSQQFKLIIEKVRQGNFSV